MNKKIVLYASALMLMIPVPGRFAYGIILTLLFNLVFLAGTSFVFAVRKYITGTMQSVVIMTFLIGMSVFLKDILIFIFPVIVLQLGVLLYFPALSVFILTAVNRKGSSTLQEAISMNMKDSGCFSLFALIYMLLRDIAGYGSISFPGFNGILAVQFINSAKIPFMCFLASLPGTIISSTVMAVLYIHVQKMFTIIERAGITDEK